MNGGASGLESLRLDDRLEVVERGDVVASRVLWACRGVFVPFAQFSCTVPLTPLSLILPPTLLSINPALAFPLQQKSVVDVRRCVSGCMVSLILLVRSNGNDLRLGAARAIIERFVAIFCCKGPR